MKPFHLVTPTYHSQSLSSLTGKEVWLKMECFQPVGSFKIRGIGALCQQAFSRGVTSIVASSGGNAGLAAAYSAKQLNLPAIIFVPESTSILMIDKMKQLDAQVIVKGKVWLDAHHEAVEYAELHSAQYIHPFDQEDIWYGHSSMIGEVKQQMPEPPDLILVSVGGGGLLCGVLEGLHRNEWQKVPVLAVETEGAASFKKSLEEGALVKLENIHTIANTLGASQVCRQAYEWSSRHPIQAELVSDWQAVDACLQFLDHHFVMVEPSCGASLAMLYHHLNKIEGQRILVIVCGGVGIDIKQLILWHQSLNSG